MARAPSRTKESGRRGPSTAAGARRAQAGATLVDLLLGALLLAIVITALMSALISQTTLNEQSRNLSWAINDAHRVLEQLREQNSGVGCASPTAIPPGAFTSWDAWLAAAAPAGGGKSINPTQPATERVFVTCLQVNPAQPIPAAGDFCGNDGAGPGADQIGTGEWRVNLAPPVTPLNPIRLSVSVCWRHRNRTIGSECQWNGAALTSLDGNANGIIDSPAIVSTVITCHS